LDGALVGAGTESKKASVAVLAEVLFCLGRGTINEYINK
jgi:hypothetical protein